MCRELADQCEVLELGAARAYLRRADWDSHALGVNAFCVDAIAYDDTTSFAEASRLVRRIQDLALERGWKFGVATVAAQSSLWIQALASVGWRPVSTLATVGKSSEDPSLAPSHMQAGEYIGEILTGDSDALVEIGRSAIRDGRYFADAAIPAEVSERFYARFASALHEGVAGGSLFGRALRAEGRLTGFAIGRVDDVATRVVGRTFGYLWLIAVAPSQQGHGLGRSLLGAFLGLAREKVSLLEISTQVTNNKAMNLYLKSGLSFAGAMQQLHWHADR